MSLPEPENYDATPFVPETISLPVLEAASKSCRGCPLYLRGTQTVFGAGPSSARIMLVGEQPGDQEDVQGKPFVGPAGRILNEALEGAQIARADVYVTNAVKHFKWVESPSGGTRRLHQRPRKAEILACKPWLEAEIQAVRPCLIVCLGVTAVQSLLGSAFRLTNNRGIALRDSPYAPLVGATIHPSAVLRTRTREDRVVALAGLTSDLKKFARELAALPASAQNGFRML
jgi:DNA polymerase